MMLRDDANGTTGSTTESSAFYFRVTMGGGRKEGKKRGTVMEKRRSVRCAERLVRCNGTERFEC